MVPQTGTGARRALCPAVAPGCNRPGMDPARRMSARSRPRPTSDKAYIYEVVDMIRDRIKLAKDRLKSDQFVHLTISRSDDVQHHYWKEYYQKTKRKNAIPKVWKTIDQEIGKL